MKYWQIISTSNIFHLNKSFPWVTFSDFIFLQILLDCSRALRVRHARWLTLALCCFISLSPRWHSQLYILEQERSPALSQSLCIQSGTTYCHGYEIFPVLCTGNPQSWTSLQPFLNCCMASLGFLPSFLFKNSVCGVSLLFFLILIHVLSLIPSYLPEFSIWFMLSRSMPLYPTYLCQMYLFTWQIVLAENTATPLPVCPSHFLGSISLCNTVDRRV